MTALFMSAGLSSSGYIAAIIVAPLIAKDLLGNAMLSGLPSAFTVVGMAIGSTVLSTRMAKSGRRSGLVLGYTVVVAAALALIATNLASFTLFSFAMFVLGAGHSANRLTRYAASDLYGSKHRATAIGWVIWAGTIGSVVGPALLEPARVFAIWLGTVETSGAYLVTIVGSLSADRGFTSKNAAACFIQRADQFNGSVFQHRSIARGTRNTDRANGISHFPRGNGASDDHDTSPHSKRR